MINIAKSYMLCSRKKNRVFSNIKPLKNFTIALYFILTASIFPIQGFCEDINELRNRALQFSEEVKNYTV